LTPRDANAVLSANCDAIGGDALPNRAMITFESLDHVRLTPHEAQRYAGDAEHEVVIAVGCATIAVRFSRPSAARAFAERFGDTLGEAAPDRVIYAVEVGGQAFFWRVADQTRRWPEVPTDELFVFFADNFALHDYLSTSDDLGLHAAVIASDACVVALVGRSTAGKTTTALAAVRNGWTFYSDDRCILQAGRVVPFLRAITLRDGGRRALLADPVAGRLTEALGALSPGQEHALRPRRLFGKLAGGPPRPLDALFLIDGRADEAAVRADPSLFASLTDVLVSMVSRECGIDRAARLLAELRAVRIFRLLLGTPHATATLIERTIDGIAAGARR